MIKNVFERDESGEHMQDRSVGKRQRGQLDAYLSRCGVLEPESVFVRGTDARTMVMEELTGLEAD